MGSAPRPRVRPPAPPPGWWGLGSVNDTRGALAHVAREMFLGEMDLRLGNALTATLSALVAVIRHGSLEERLVALERRLGLEGQREVD